MTVAEYTLSVESSRRVHRVKILNIDTDSTTSTKSTLHSSAVASWSTCDRLPWSVRC